MLTSRRVPRGISLVDGVVLLSVAALGLGLILPALGSAQIFARRVRTEDNLRQIALAIANYESANGSFPMSLVAGEGRGVGHSGFTALLPYLEHVMVYNAYNFDLEPWSSDNSTVTRTRIDTFLAAGNTRTDVREAKDVLTLDGKPYPGTNQFGPLHFGMNWGGGHKGSGEDFVEKVGIFRGLLLPVVTPEGKKMGVTNVRLADVLDGTSFTLGVVEKRDSSGWTVGGFAGSEFDAHTSPAYDGDDPRLMKSLTGASQPKGPWGAFADGSARILPPTMKTEIWYALLTRNGGEPVPQNAFEP